jgi:hypothetical protein
MYLSYRYSIKERITNINLLFQFTLICFTLTSAKFSQDLTHTIRVYEVIILLCLAYFEMVFYIICHWKRFPFEAVSI